MKGSPEPSVLVLLVATNGEAWLPGVIEGIASQTYPAFDVLAVDNASNDRSGALLRESFGAKRVVTLDRRAGYGRALAAGLKVAAERGVALDAVLLLHDDAAMRPGTIAALVETLGSSEEVGIAGAKLVDWDDEGSLQDIGRTTDRYGRTFSPIEKGERDHGQHDAPREVLYASSACMLVSRRVIEAVGLFDLRYVALRDDYDLCWRARLAGFRTVVDGAASARHALAGYRQVRAAAVSGRVRYFGDRNMIATQIKNYSLPRLALTLPVTIALALAGSILFAVTGRRRAALQVLEALQWNLVHLPSTLRLRTKVQGARTVSDAEVTRLMSGGAHRVRTYIERAFEKVVGEVETVEGDEPAPPPSILERIRAHPAVVPSILIGLLVIVGSRTILRSGPLAGADMPPFPAGAAEMFGEFFGGWRTAGTGGAGPATPGLLLFGALQFALFGSAWLAQRALLLGLPLAAGVSMWRLSGAMGFAEGGRRAATLAYALSPLALAALGEGRLADLVLIAAAPALLAPIVRAAGLAPQPADWRSVMWGVAGTAVVTSLAPWAIVFVAGGGVAIGAARAVAGSRANALPAVRRGLAMAGGAFVLLLPWSLELLRQGSPLGYGGESGPAPMSDLVGLVAGGVRAVPVWALYPLPVAALAGLLMSVETRRAQARALAVAAVAALGVAFAVARGVPFIAPRPALPLILASVCFALLAAALWESLRPRLSARTFGAAHLATAWVAVGLAVQLLVAVAWFAGGSRPGLVAADEMLPSFLAAEQVERGAFRVLWVTGESGEVSASVGAPEGQTMRTYAARLAGSGEEALRRVVASIASGSTESGARMLATFGVRYVVLRPGASSGLLDGMERQSDLRFTQTFGGSRIYQNEADLSLAASVSAPGWVAASRRSLDTIAAAEPRTRGAKGLQGATATSLSGRAAKGAPVLVLAQDYSPRWRLLAGSIAVEPARSFGWANAFALPESKAALSVRLEWRGRGRHLLALAGHLALVLAFAAGWSRRAAVERGER